MTDASKEKRGILRQDKLVAFEDKNIRRCFHKGEWYFSILDIVRVLTDTPNPRRYWPDLKKQLSENEGVCSVARKNRATEISKATYA